MFKKRFSGALIAGLLLTQPVFAMDGSLSQPPGVVEGASAFGGGGGLEIPSEIPNMVAGHETKKVPEQDYTHTTTHYWGGKSTTYKIAPSFKVSFDGSGTAILHLYNHIAVSWNGWRRWNRGSYALSKVGEYNGGYRYCSGSRSYVGKMCITVKFDSVDFEPFIGSRGQQRVYGHHNRGGTNWHHYQAATAASWAK